MRVSFYTGIFSLNYENDRKILSLNFIAVRFSTNWVVTYPYSQQIGYMHKYSFHKSRDIITILGKILVGENIGEWANPGYNIGEWHCIHKISQFFPMPIFSTYSITKCWQWNMSVNYDLLSIIIHSHVLTVQQYSITCVYMYAACIDYCKLESFEKLYLNEFDAITLIKCLAGLVASNWIVLAWQFDIHLPAFLCQSFPIYSTSFQGSLTGDLELLELP